MPSSDSDESPPPSITITAAPDVEGSPADAKKPKLLHFEASEPPKASCSNPQVQENGQPGTPNAKVESRFDTSAGGEEEASEDNGESPVVAAVPLPDETVTEKDEEFWDLKMSWSGKVYEMRVGANDMVYDFREKIQSLTNVPPERQKLIGLQKGKLSSALDSTRFGTLGVKKDSKFTMIGTSEELSFKDEPTRLSDVYDEFDVLYPESLRRHLGAVLPSEDSRNKRRLDSIIKAHPITIMNEPRPGKKLLVLDLDYTMVDTKPLIAGSLPAAECARPGLHDFLEAVYPHYDIVIWSQTHWRWLETKLVELDVIGGTQNYKVCFVSDKSTMFPVFTLRNGQPYKHEVKPLGYFWAKFPHWSAANTIHIDDLSRNFAMNPGEGLKIRAFQGAGTPNGLYDRELHRLKQYLLHIATNVSDFTTLDHSKWKKHVPSR